MLCPQLECPLLSSTYSVKYYANAIFFLQGSLQKGKKKSFSESLPSLNIHSFLGNFNNVYSSLVCVHVLPLLCVPSSIGNVSYEFLCPLQFQAWF